MGHDGCISQGALIAENIVGDSTGSIMEFQLKVAFITYKMYGHVCGLDVGRVK